MNAPDPVSSHHGTPLQLIIPFVQFKERTTNEVSTSYNDIDITYSVLLSG